MFVTSESVETDVEGLTKRFIAVLSKSTSAFCNNHKPYCLASLSNRVTRCPMVAARCLCLVNFKHLTNTLFFVVVSIKNEQKTCCLRTIYLILLSISVLISNVNRAVGRGTVGIEHCLFTDWFKQVH